MIRIKRKDIKQLITSSLIARIEGVMPKNPYPFGTTLYYCWGRYEEELKQKLTEIKKEYEK